MTGAVEIEREFANFVGSDSFSCLVGKGVVHQNAHVVRVYPPLGTRAAAGALASDLNAFAAAEHDPMKLRAFVAVFPRFAPRTELAFEARLWAQLQWLHECDDPEAEWDPSVSDDADDPMFSFSFGGHAYFIVGLHAHSSRVSRSFRWPALVFNPHSQFGRLRGEGRFKRIQVAIREREIAVQGSLNPNLADFGERSEARQYSGRAVEDNWRCPFHRSHASGSENP
ncbi:MAG TPA: guanitoxin biosynthesis heme-dependent pre-guanitoxin N-hydroxylase GntA [Gemmatimonadaceae bacterium]|nr:guanitoxin biosynthesis heme-dependent pre-guanitoxin N-hydroxylase GntA [Gemmatimonadaceae bacterium]